LLLLFKKEAADIEAVDPKRLNWSKYTQEQAQKGGLASVDTHGEQMRNGGLAGGPKQVGSEKGPDRVLLNASRRSSSNSKSKWMTSPPSCSSKEINRFPGACCMHHASCRHASHLHLLLRTGADI
jgi:hypothetical protein